jgi:hypothetical protein
VTLGRPWCAEVGCQRATLAGHLRVGWLDRGVPATTYHFSDTAAVDAPVARVHELLVDLERYVEWWPQVRAVASLGPDDALLVCRSVLPFDLEVRLHAVSRARTRLEVAVSGPLDGWVRWVLAADGPDRTLIRMEQQVRVGAWPLVLGSYVAKPLLRANHTWMMRRGARGMRRRLGPGPGPQRRAATAAS